MILAREAIELLGQMARILWFEGTKHGLRDREWMALRFLSRANRFSRTPSALASYVGTTRGTASFIIGELERLGYLERKRSATDKRSVTLSVTQQGKKFLVRDPISVLLEPIAVLDDEAKIRFRDTLRHVLDQADAAEQRHHTDVCKRCIFLREDRTATDGKPSAAEFSCRLFRAPIAEAEIDLLCTSFEHHRQ
ncbi:MULTISPECIES: MarR family winged helix-turn-helix transcriptional regulator [Bradyrhizobium]|uniref:MarR family winged helix-turn-helix transcriptional regulator n=1 Tax=Bradyrhizobium TaxID=374 RepID=UPI000231CC99|nr:MarR family transcriptional regulator [Bradyrhizobium japonicum]AJA61094.1 MarR family transcriptional regulator [Bradyrhizobium japonicum]KMJ99639.1 MarR family transcriptional regulator [Bradyrhizobium japonicum]MCS3533869.1 DNA-binding MarR family transcriptional regulator [Bradyrhizobium japonicum]MCS3990037.1 DNA-binding MarR family transcriptional regulator [Bradyrhizobium japonicum]MCS4015150.1 DNA-binding MarR family transcriptional regulator [Bradyrhizobium japonicum]